MYHRQLIRLPAGVTDVKTIRIANAATAGGASAQRRDLRRHRVARQGPPAARRRVQEPAFFTQYQDPTENRAHLDALAARVPGADVASSTCRRRPRGYQRKSQAIMSGERHRRGSARRPRRPADRHHGRDHGRAAGREDPVHRDRGAGHPGDRRRDPVRLDRLHPDPQGPRRHHPADGRHGDEPGVHQPDAAPRPAPTASRSRASRATSATSRSRSSRSSAARRRGRAVVLTAKDWGQDGGDQVMAEFRSRAAQQPAAERRRQRQAASRSSSAPTPPARRTRRPRRSSPRSTPSRRPPRCVTATTYRGNAGAGIVPPRAHGQPGRLPQRSRERPAWSVPAAPVPDRLRP